MAACLETEFGNLQLELFPERFAYIRKLNTILVSDLHLGRSGHYRKHGIPMPASAETLEVLRLERCIKKVNAQRILILGDLFHSAHNADVDRFVRWREFYENIDFQLVPGNHDIIHTSFYEHAKIKLMDKEYEEEGVLFLHESKPDESRLHISGHVHPAVVLRGQGKQSLRLNCFYQTSNQFLLPAFTSWGGHFTIKPKRGDKVFVCAETELHLFDN